MKLHLRTSGSDSFVFIANEEMPKLCHLLTDLLISLVTLDVRQKVQKENL